MIYCRHRLPGGTYAHAEVRSARMLFRCGHALVTFCAASAPRHDAYEPTDKISAGYCFMPTVERSTANTLTRAPPDFFLMERLLRLPFAFPDLADICAPDADSSGRMPMDIC